MDGPDAARRLGRANDPAALRAGANSTCDEVLIDLAADLDPAGDAVDVGASKLEQLALAQPTKAARTMRSRRWSGMALVMVARLRENLEPSGIA